MTDAITLALPSGRLVIGDPAVLFGDARPVDAVLPEGEFPVRVTPAGVEVLLAPLEPVRWQETARTPSSASTGAGSAGVGSAGVGSTGAGSTGAGSGHLALLDVTALADYSDLGDEPIDEFELLTERLRERPGSPIAYGALVVVPCESPVDAVLVGFDELGAVCRVQVRFMSR